jgi:hypothetical protein
MMATHEFVVPRSIPITSPASSDLYLLAVERGSDKNEVAVAFWKEVLTVASRDEADPRRSKLDVLVVTAEESMVVVLLYCIY